MKIIFSDINPEVARALATAFEGVPGVEAHRGDIFDHKAQGIVSPANSFGYMDGGIDLVYCRHFGWDVQTRLQLVIDEEFEGELLVGQAAVVPTNDADIPLLVAAPTMRVPMNIGGTVNAYLAFRAALRAARRHGIESLLCPGMGTFVGHLDPEVAAGQMRIAHMEFIGGVIFDPPGLRSEHHNHHLIANGLRGAWD